MKIVQVTAEVLIPKPPNFIRCEDGSSLPIEAIQESGLREIGKQWTENLIEKAKERSKEKK